MRKSPVIKNMHSVITLTNIANNLTTLTVQPQFNETEPLVRWLRSVLNRHTHATGYSKCKILVKSIRYQYQPDHHLQQTPAPRTRTKEIQKPRCSTFTRTTPPHMPFNHLTFRNLHTFKVNTTLLQFYSNLMQ